MDPIVLAALLSGQATVLAAVIQRTNGRGPLAKKLNKLEHRMLRLEAGFSRNAAARAEIVAPEEN